TSTAGCARRCRRSTLRCVRPFDTFLRTTTAVMATGECTEPCDVKACGCQKKWCVAKHASPLALDCPLQLLPPFTVTATSFSTLPLASSQLESLAQLGYTTMTPIQAQSLPLILEGRDVIAQAKTGSGKTAAFGLGILHRLNPQRWEIQALVVCPTRELSEQVATEVRRLARSQGNIKVLTLTGGASARPQLESLAHGAHIIVGTPGRLLDLMDRGSLDLSSVHTLVLDEADRMVDMGF